MLLFTVMSQPDLYIPTQDQLREIREQIPAVQRLRIIIYEYLDDQENKYDVENENSDEEEVITPLSPISICSQSTVDMDDLSMDDMDDADLFVSGDEEEGGSNISM